ncbi:MAG: Eco57I restriction-modification methylase domain-containing protein, partial [Proteobacteria bacterium]|nr:Eco57I restriction-modification methylase domain-containing protein [Pseudomonadota bacterium]
FKKAKDKLDQGLRKLTDDLDGILYIEQYKGVNLEEKEYRTWLATHQPFHWFAEFYEIIKERSGFDVVIGNPPYVEYSKVKKDYQIKEFRTEGCGNLYVFVLERCNQFIDQTGWLGMILPLSICSGERMSELRSLSMCSFKNLYLSNFEIFPSKLFEGAFQRLTILTGSQKKETIPSSRFVTKLHRWYSIERENLINKINYSEIIEEEALPLFGKYQSDNSLGIINHITKQKKTIAHFCVKTRLNCFIYYQEATNYWMKASIRVPFYKKNGKIGSPAHGRFLYFEKEKITSGALALLNSSLFYLWYITYSDGFHLSDLIVKRFPVDENLLQNELLIKAGRELERDIKNNAVITTRNTKKDDIEIETFKLSQSKPLIDQIDCLIAQHYGFTHEELDFIINYDIKYRMGKELNRGEDNND